MMADKDTIYTAIPKAMAQIKRLAKESRNDHDKYQFASIDDFLAMTGPIMAEHGLFITMDEESVVPFERQGKYGPTHWLSVTFLITVWHESGEHMAPVRRTVEVIRTGAQSFGSAQSYAIKQFQRALLNIPTGDKDDADFGEKGEGPAIREPHKAREPASPPPPPFNAVEARDRIKAKLESAATLAELHHHWTSEADDIARLKADDPPKLGEVTKAKDDAKARLAPETETAE